MKTENLGHLKSMLEYAYPLLKEDSFKNDKIQKWLIILWRNVEKTKEQPLNIYLVTDTKVFTQVIC